MSPECDSILSGGNIMTTEKSIAFLRLREEEALTQIADAAAKGDDFTRSHWQGRLEQGRECIELLSGRINTNVELRDGFVRSL